MEEESKVANRDRVDHQAYNTKAQSSVFTSLSRWLQIKKEGNGQNQYIQATHLAQDTAWESDKNTIKHHIQESQEVILFCSRWPQENKTNTKHK